MNKANLNFEKIDNPYDYKLDRVNSDVFSLGGQKFNSEGLPIADASEEKNSDSKQGPGAGSPSGSPTVPMQEDLWISNWIKSRNYKPKSQGFLIDGRLGYIECMKLYVGTGGIVGGSINIPDAVNPKFSVDNEGNAKVKSLRREDFHWFTAFESIDGYGQVGTAGTTAGVGTGALQIYCDNVNTHFRGVVKILYYNSGAFTWDKNSKIKFGFVHLLLGANTLRMGRGGYTNNTERKIGFLVSNQTLYGITANGTNYTLVEYGVISNGTEYRLEYNHTAGTSVEFFVNGVSIGTSTTNIPTGTSLANYVMMAHLTTDENVEKVIYIGYWDFWQAN